MKGNIHYKADYDGEWPAGFYSAARKLMWFRAELDACTWLQFTYDADGNAVGITGGT